MTLYYKDKNLSNNVTLAGSPTVNSFVIGNFSKNNYASYKGSSQTCNTIEAVWKVTTGSDVTTQQGITAGNPYKCIISLQIISGVVQTYISSDGSTNNIASGVRSFLTVSANTTYWFKYTFNGSVYKIDVSTDGNTYINYINISNTNKIPFEGFLGLGKDTGSAVSVSEADVHFYGSIDLSQCYVKINGSFWWKGVDYKLLKIRDYDTTGVYCGSKPIGFIHQNGKLLYKGRHYEAWSVPSGALSKGYSATGEASGSIGNLFDKNHDTRWGQGVQGNRKWFRLTLPYPVIVDAITVIQGFAGSHNDSRINNVTFYAELTGTNSTGGQIQISNKQSLNWDVKSSTAITITNKPICKQIYCWTEGQAYSTLGEVYISGRRVL